MITCTKCGAPMAMLFTSTYCSRECDRKPITRAGSVEMAQPVGPGRFSTFSFDEIPLSRQLTRQDMSDLFNTALESNGMPKQPALPGYEHHVDAFECTRTKFDKDATVAIDRAVAGLNLPPGEYTIKVTDWSITTEKVK